MKVSIITVCFNNDSTIKDAIDSVFNQSYKNIEYIIIDGDSADTTRDIITSYGNKIDQFVSESDRGIYHAMNKGIKLAKGDIVGMLNADDFFSDSNIIEKLVKEFVAENLDAVFGDVQFVKSSNLYKIVRYYSSKRFNSAQFKYGFMPAHPSFYVKRELFNKYGFYKEDYKIASDYELMIRFLYKTDVKSKYIETPFVTMRTGGTSNKTIKSRFILNKEIVRACSENRIKTNLFNIYLKYFKKIFEFVGNN